MFDLAQTKASTTPPALRISPYLSLDLSSALLSRHEAARYLGVSHQTLAAWASNRRVDIPFVKIGRRVQYRLIDLEAFCAANRKGVAASTSLEVQQ